MTAPDQQPHPDKKLEACNHCFDKITCGKWLTEHDASIAAAARKQAITEVLLWREENRGKKVGYCTNGIIEDQFLTELIGLDCWTPEEYNKKIAVAARTEATIECRKIVGDKVISNKCPFNGDCAQCFLCDNTGGCIVRSDEEIAKLCKGARAEGAREERERIYRILYDFNDSFKSSIHVDELGQLIESLRSQQPGGEDGGAGK